jgi:hypothetical protein
MAPRNKFLNFWFGQVWPQENIFAFPHCKIVTKFSWGQGCLQKCINKKLSDGYANTLNPTRISKMCSQKNVVAIHAKQRNLWRCYTVFWGKNCALSLCQTLQDEFQKVKICGYRKRYTGVFVNPSKPFAFALLGIMISSRQQLFLIYIHVWQPWLSSQGVFECDSLLEQAIYCHKTQATSLSALHQVRGSHPTVQVRRVSCSIIRHTVHVTSI